MTAEDVQSSLYFVHISEEADEQFFDEHKEPPSANSNNKELPPILEPTFNRKPIVPSRPQAPTTPPYPVHDEPPPEIERPPSPPKHHQVARKPVRSNTTASERSRFPSDPTLPELPRRPLPTPPDEQPPRLSLHEDNVRLLRRSDHSDDNNPFFRRYSEDPGATPDNRLNVPKLEAGSLTLIRRDPTAGEQWNVATIHDPPVHEISSSALLNPSSAMRTKQGGMPLFLDVTHPGYLQFVDPSRPVSRNSTSTGSSDAEPPPDGVFRRRLYMPGSRYGEHRYGHRRFKSEDSGSAMRNSMRDHDLSDFSNGSPRWDRRSKGYSFKSPWEGQCEFTTGATGKSLKCRHTLGRQGTTEVSELRFNLPTSTRNMPAPPSDKRASIFSRHSRLSTAGNGDDDSIPTVMLKEDGSVDLSLGQERAGGGLGGKQAKLGKLIIAPEGMKMLDLLVAANVGLWWRAYERP